jgi:hypothetical protein
MFARYQRRIFDDLTPRSSVWHFIIKLAFKKVCCYCLCNRPLTSISKYPIFHRWLRLNLVKSAATIITQVFLDFVFSDLDHCILDIHLLLFEPFIQCDLLLLRGPPSVIIYIFCFWLIMIWTILLKTWPGIWFESIC